MRMISMICLFLCNATLVEAQGKFFYWNYGPPTRVGSNDGHLAGPEIYGQMLVGLTPDSLKPILVAIPHHEGGKFGTGLSTVVPNVPCDNTRVLVFMQMVAWDSRLWGTELAGVPADQLGRTDVVPHTLDCVAQVWYAPRFTMAAIVPIPEPPTWALALLTAPLLWIGQRLPRMNARGRQLHSDANHGDTKSRRKT